MSVLSPKGRPGSLPGPLADPEDAWRVEFPSARPSLQARLTRPALMVLVFLGAIWAFSAHFADVAKKIDAQTTIVDETGRLSPADLERLRLAARFLRAGYGVTLRLSVRPGPVDPPPLDAATAFVGLDTASGRSVVVLPPLLAKALSPETAAALTGPFFDTSFAANAWPEGLSAWVTQLVESLDETAK